MLKYRKRQSVAAVTEPINRNELKPDEKDVLRLYRRLRDNDKRWVRDYIKGEFGVE